MENPETVATLDVQNTGRKQTKQGKKQHRNIKYEQHGSHRRPWVNPGAREG